MHIRSINIFELVAIIPTSKYNSFQEESKTAIEESIWTKGLAIKDVLVKDPNNPAALIEAKLIVFLVN